MTQSEKYNGIEELELLDSAHNYTNSITTRINSFFSKDLLTLDFGAGAGTYAKKLKSQDYKITCIEIDPTLIGVLKNHDLDVSKSTADFESGSVHQIYSINVLEHIEDDLGILKEFHRMLTSSGKIYLYLPAFPVLYSKFDKKIGHYRRYKKKDLVQKLTEAGFQIEQRSYRDSIGFFVAYLFKIISNSEDVSKTAITIYDKIVFPFSRLLDPLLGAYFGKNIEVMATKKNEQIS